MSRKASELIHLLVNHPDYLDRVFYLCYLKNDLHAEGLISDTECDIASIVIYELIDRFPTEKGGGAPFLKTLLEIQEKVSYGVSLSSSEYHKAAHDFWKEGIELLKAQGR